MPDPPPQGSLPPEVPEEFAAAYRAAYEQALQAQSDESRHRSEPEHESRRESRRRPSEREDDDTVELPARRGRLRVGTHRTEAYDDQPTMLEKVTDSHWFVPLLLGVLAMLLILGAYAIGRAFADRVNDDSSSGSAPSVVMSEGGGKVRQPTSTQPPGEGAYDGKVQSVGNLRATASCTSPPGKDAAGDKVSYAAANLTDGVADTTWRCDGTAIGEKITLTLPDKTAIGEVGLIPGYAKTDPATEDDRYAENNRVTQVRWTIGKTIIEQSLDGATDDRSLRLLRVPKTDATTVQLEILAVKKGPRNTTAISEVQLGRAD